MVFGNFTECYVDCYQVTEEKTVKPSIDQMTELFEQIKSGRVTGDKFQSFIQNPDSYNANIGRFGSVYMLKVNYDLKIDELIMANKFDWKTDAIHSSVFPCKRGGVRLVKVELYEFDNAVTGKEALEHIGTEGYKVEDVHVLLTFGKHFPIEQLRRPTLALGSLHRDGDKNVEAPGLNGGDFGQRHLSLCNLKYKFYPNWRFLVSRKES